MDLVEIFKVINTPSRSRPALVKKVNDYLLNLIGAGTGNEDYQEFFKQIPSNWTTLSVDKQFAFNNPGMYHIGDKDSQFLLINNGVSAKTNGNIFLLGSVFGKKVVSAEFRSLSELLDTAMLVDDLLLVLDIPDYKILNWIVTPIESLVGVE